MSMQLTDSKRHWNGVVAQLVERLVRNEKVAGSIPVGSTIPQEQELCAGKAFSGNRLDRVAAVAGCGLKVAGLENVAALVDSEG
jgi:hypothetical protein